MLAFFASHCTDPVYCVCLFLQDALDESADTEDDSSEGTNTEDEDTEDDDNDESIESKHIKEYIEILTKIAGDKYNYDNYAELLEVAQYVLNCVYIGGSSGYCKG